MSSQPLDYQDTPAVDPAAPFGLGQDPSPSRANLVGDDLSEHPVKPATPAAPPPPPEMHPLKEALWLFLARANMSTAMKQKVHDLLIKTYGEHPNDPMRQPDDPKWD